MRSVVHIVTNIDRFVGTEERTGLWLGELVHVWDQLEARGIPQIIASPAGGESPLEPRSLLPLVADRATVKKHEDPAFMELLRTTTPVANVDWHDVDAVYLTGGHGVMYDFPDCEPLQQLIADLYANGRLVASVCHGYTGLLNVTLDGVPFLQGKRITGFSWAEEIAAGVAKRVPFNVEEVSKERGADYRKSLLPMTTHLEQDGRLITGQNPASAKAVGKALVNSLRVLHGD